MILFVPTYSQPKLIWVLRVCTKNPSVVACLIYYCAKITVYIIYNIYFCALLLLHLHLNLRRNLKGHSYENVGEIIALNDRLDPN
jgi:hypothetical protein